MEEKKEEKGFPEDQKGKIPGWLLGRSPFVNTVIIAIGVFFLIAALVSLVDKGSGRPFRDGSVPASLAFHKVMEKSMYTSDAKRAPRFAHREKDILDSMFRHPDREEDLAARLMSNREYLKYAARHMSTSEIRMIVDENAIIEAALAMREGKSDKSRVAKGIAHIEERLGAMSMKIDKLGKKVDRLGKKIAESGGKRYDCIYAPAVMPFQIPPCVAREKNVPPCPGVMTPCAPPCEADKAKLDRIIMGIDRLSALQENWAAGEGPLFDEKARRAIAEGMRQEMRERTDTGIFSEPQSQDSEILIRPQKDRDENCLGDIGRFFYKKAR